MKTLLGRPLAWLVAGLCAASAAGYWQAASNEAEMAQRFDNLSRRAVEQLADRMQTYDYGLLGARGAVISAGGEYAITRQRFAQYSASRDLEREFPGARGIGFVRRVPASQEEAFVAEARRDGRPDFKVRQIEPNPGERYVVQFLEPGGANDAAVGLDIASEPKRREAAERAMLSGHATLSAPITLIDRNSGNLRAFLLLLPVMRGDVSPSALRQRLREPLPEARARQETVGWVFSPLVIDEVLKGFDFQDGEFSLALYDSTDPQKPERFYASASAGNVYSRLPKVVLPLKQFGRDWTVEVAARPPFLRLLNLRNPWAVFGIGTALTMLAVFLSYMRKVTGRRTELASEQRSRLAAIVASSNDAIIGRRLDGTITDWNPAAAAIFGYEAEEAVGQSIYELLVPPEQLVEEQEINAHIASSHPVAAFETVRRRRDGRMVTVSIAAAPIRSANGRVIGAAQTLRDITHDIAAKARILELNATLEQQVAERTAEVRALSARERALLAGAGSAIIATDAKGRVTLFNPAAEALLGYKAAEVVNKLSMNRFHDAAEVHERTTRITARLGRPLEVGEVFSAGKSRSGGDLEWTYVRKDGTRVPVHLNVSPLRNVEGRITGFVAIAADLSERKRAEEAARDNERFMRIVTDNIPGVVAYWTRDMVCTFANSAYERWLGIKPEQMIGMTQLQVTGPELFELNEPFMLAAIDGREQRVERTRQLADGSTVHYWLHYIPDRDENGAVKGFISVAVDVTEMKQAQNQLETLNLALNERSAQAESASRAKSDFLANMSHEIRSPLNAVVGLAYLLRQTPLDARQRNYLEKIEGASSSLLSVINDILDISKIEAGQMVLDEHEFELATLLDDAISMMAVNADLKGVALLLDPQEGLPARLRGDPGRLRQIVVNLLSNAIKFTAEGAVRLEVQKEVEEGGRIWLRFAVHDTGIGIAPDVVERLFTPFTQADMSTTRRFGGTGLGLSIVKQLTALMEGTYGVNSTPGEGSEFWVVLPLMLIDTGANAAASPGGLPNRPSVRPVSGTRLAGARVLVVDDSPINLEVCQHILEREGATVELANNGLEGLQAVRDARMDFDVVLMDVHMPVLDGHEATRQIRREPGHARLPVVALTASALVAERDRAIEAGMNDFISKPFDAEALIRCVRRYADRGLGGGSSEPGGLHDELGSIPSGWPRIEGIDATDSHARLGGDAELLRSVLRRLLDDALELAPLPGGPILKGPSLAARLHKMRGSAGMIGALRVSELASAAEASVKAGNDEQAQSLMRSLGAALRQLRLSSKDFLDAGQAEPDLSFDASTPSLTVDRLEPLLDALRTQSISALQLFDDLAPSLRATLGAAPFAALRQAVENLQFPRAVDMLEAVDVG
ncbi:Histidine kinase [Burkholderiales bacterium 8X]|nr:Histidine kinase [Burkholderiales bacterium 8X]